MTKTKQINKTFGVIKSSEVLKDVGGTSDDSLWAFASVEVADSVGDIVRIDGIDWADYHNPPNSHLKMLAQHLKALPDGSAPVVGRVEEFRKIASNGSPALAFRMSWARDGAGVLTPLAKSYKDLYDGGYLDSFSVGMIVNEAQPLKKTGGYDFTRTTLMEISCVTIPANSLATVMRALEDADLGDQIDREKVLTEAVNEMSERVAKSEEIAMKMAEKVAELSLQLEATCESNKEVEGRLTAALEEKLASLVERLDYIESSLVAESDGQPSPTSDRQDGQTKADKSIDLTAITAALANLSAVVACK